MTTLTRRPGTALHRFVDHLEDAVLLICVVLMVPLVILAIGAPVALFVRLVVEIARRW